MPKKRKIQQVILFWLLLLTLSSCAVLTIFIVQVQYRNFLSESKHFRKQYTEEQKALLKQKVIEAENYINHSSSKINQRLKESIKSRVYEAWDTANHLYTTYSTSKSKEELTMAIKESLRPIRFNQGRGYYFAVSLDGVEELYPTRPELEGKNLIDLQDVAGKYVIKNEINTVMRSGEGFISGHWPNPLIENDPGSLEYSFVKLFKPLNWYLGTGEFVQNVENDIQAEVLDWLSEIRFGHSSYIFAETIQGDALLMDGKVVNEPINIWDLEDPDGIKVIQEEIKLAQSNPRGGFLRYSWKREGGNTPVPVLSYVLAVPQWKWVIGASIYLDDIENYISLQEQRMKDNVNNDIKKIVLFMALCIITIFSVSFFISRRFNKELHVFSTFFSLGKDKQIGIPLDELEIKEFHKLGEVANQMIEQRKEAEEKLRKLSLTDPLTGLSNRRDMTQKITLESKRADRSGTDFAFILIDIDHFKKVNDTYGHDAGDVVLKGIASILLKEARQTDTISRWGGEEFLLLLPNAESEGACNTAEKFRKRIEAKQFTHNEQVIRVTLTLGVSMCHKGCSPEEAISLADKALYQGKSYGRNRVINAYDPTDKMPIS